LNKKPEIFLVAAVAKNNVLGKDNKLIWHLPADLKMFKNLTSYGTILMGRKTFESLGKPLPNRENVIVTKDVNYKQEGCLVFNSIEQALENLNSREKIFIVGGAQIYKECISMADKLYITHLDLDIEGDVFFPEIDSNVWRLTKNEEGILDEKNLIHHRFCEYERKD
jgi:dihydrofolate reductase